MAYSLTRLADLRNLPFETVIDVRSPAEFALDHLPGAINLPVLDDAERARVGTVYVQESAFKARKIGAVLVARNAARHIEERLFDRGKGWKPLIYCWRGGQRSGSFATILKQVGWRADLLDGGYRSYRRLVNDALYNTPFPAPVVLLDGNTGSAKTDVLAALAQRGVQVIDLEGLANHRGSLFGAMAGGQPAQKAFETLLVQRIMQLDPARPVVIEAESAKVGERLVPASLWSAMKQAPRLEIQAPLAARAKYLVRAYHDMVADAAVLAQTLDRLRPYHSAAQIEAWHGLAEAGDMEQLASELMALHYDTRYGKARERAVRITPLPVSGLEPQDIEQLADRIAKLLQD
jgi:tRNA 2-selenouridine synthase